MRSIRLKNFRSFEDTERIELKPITILVGANSSGKSSFLRFFPLLRQTVETLTRSPLLWYSDTGYVDFGNFSQAVRRGVQPREIGVEIDLEIDPTLHRRWRSRVFATFAVSLIEEEGRTWVRECAVTHHVESPQLTLFGIDGPQTFVVRDWDPERARNSLIPPDSAQMPGELREALNGGRLVLDRFAKGVRYVGPFRFKPERYYREQELSIQQIDPHGENLAVFLRALRRRRLEDLSRFVHEHLGFAVRVATEGGQVSILIAEGNNEAFNLIDMGYGISQVLPIVVQAWAIKSGFRVSMRDVPTTMFAIEQPELHLHPKYQARLADVFVGVVTATRATAGAGGVPRLLVETHSKSLINRLGERIEDGVLSPEDVSVLLFERDEKTGITRIRRSRFTEDGSLKNWPVGFFAP